MYRFFYYLRKAFLVGSVFFISFSIFSYNPLEPLLWPDPEFKSKLTFSKFTHFKKPISAKEFQGSIYGYLESKQNPTESKYKILKDTLGINKNFKVLSQLPRIKLKFSIENSKFIPDSRSLQSTANLFWDVQYGVGDVWYDEFGNIRSSFPFSLIQKNQNCVHNGVILFDMTEDGGVSNLVYQVASETCSYFKFDLIGSFEAFISETESSKPIDGINYQEWSQSNIPLKSISKLGESSKYLGSTKEVAPENMTIYGFYDGEFHYRGGCLTRKGRYPYCSELLVPSFSIAKSIFASNAMSLLEIDFPGVKDSFISDYVPECSAKKWRGVTFENTLDMATGQYQYEKFYSEDWYLTKEGFSKLYKHKDKINFSCKVFKKKTIPGKKFSYHSSDTYILGTALNNFYKAKVDPTGDIYSHLLVPLWKSLGLSDSLHEVTRSIDEIRQPYAEMGMFLVSDDVVKLGKYFLGKKKEVHQGILFNALQKNNDNHGLVAIKNVLYYNKGFWTKKFSGKQFGCPSDLWIPFMSGFGGITIVLLPNDTVYYYFSDGDEFEWDQAVKFANDLKPFCY